MEGPRQGAEKYPETPKNDPFTKIWPYFGKIP